MFIHFAGEGWCSLDNEFVYALVRAAVASWLKLLAIFMLDSGVFLGGRILINW